MVAFYNSTQKEHLIFLQPNFATKNEKENLKYAYNINKQNMF